MLYCIHVLSITEVMSSVTCVPYNTYLDTYLPTLALYVLTRNLMRDLFSTSDLMGTICTYDTRERYAVFAGAPLFRCRYLYIGNICTYIPLCCLLYNEYLHRYVHMLMFRPCYAVFADAANANPLGHGPVSS